MADLPTADPPADRRLARDVARWFAGNARPLPWRTEPRDPWRSLMSEIMLQQTQVARVAERFDAFVRRFPTPKAMAARPVDDVLELWSGLGYYRRARALHQCATAIVERHGGAVPSSIEELRALPGIGRYTAGAVASIVFGQPEPLVDGNVSRVLLRLHGVQRAADEPRVQAWAWRRAQDLAQATSDVPAYSEGIMELGATMCTPKAPQCDRCPLRARCRARREGATDRIPRPKARADRQPLAMTAIVVSDARGRVLLERRPQSGLWAGLLQPPCVERAARTPHSKAAAVTSLGLQDSVDVLGRASRFPFQTTHRSVVVRVWKASTSNPSAAGRARGPGARWYEVDHLDALGLASAQRRMLEAAGVLPFSDGDIKAPPTVRMR